MHDKYFLDVFKFSIKGAFTVHLRKPTFVARAQIKKNLLRNIYRSVQIKTCSSSHSQGFESTFFS